MTGQAAANPDYRGVMAAYRLLTTRPAAEAHVVLGALHAEGLRARLQRDSFGTVYGLTSGPFATRILVHPDDYDAARALLAASEAPWRPPEQCG